MASRALRLLLAVGAALGVAALPALAAPPPAVPNGFVGVNLDGPMYPDTAPGINLAQQFVAMQAAGVESVRVVCDWSQTQPYKSWSEVPAADAGLYTNAGGVPTDFAPIDELVGLAAQHGMAVLPTVMYAPLWDIRGESSESFGRPAKDGPYANFLTDLVDRYGPQGSFWQYRAGPIEPIREWQIWNEPNISLYWPAQAFARSYVALLIAAHTAIKRADPGAEVVLAGFPDFSWLDLEAVYQVPGARAAFDVAGVHPYTATAKGVITILRYVRAVMDAHGDAAKPMLADEVGFPSSHGFAIADGGLGTTVLGQAQRTAAALPLLARYRASLNLAGFDYYTWASQEIPHESAFLFAGLLRYVAGALVKKPAFSAFAKAALAIEHCRRKGALATICAQP